jgi:putative membrane protein
MSIFWILIIVGLVFLAKWLIYDSKGEKFTIQRRSESRAIDLLKERYARGEIDKAEFEAKKKDLMDNTP